jgi:molybdenum cofactor biosynthesis protein B
MSDQHPRPRVVVATVALGRSSVREDLANLVVDELDAAKFTFVRGVTVNREKSFITQLISHISNSNEADAIVFIGGVGIGPRDYTCEAIDELADRRIEGFGEAFRELLRTELQVGVGSLLARAMAGVCNKCVVIALPRQPIPLQIGMRRLVVPTLVEAVRTAAGIRPPLSAGPPSAG